MKAGPSKRDAIGHRARWRTSAGPAGDTGDGRIRSRPGLIGGWNGGHRAKLGLHEDNRISDPNQCFGEPIGSYEPREEPE